MSKGAAKKWAVEIRLQSNSAEFNGEPVTYTYNFAYVGYGLPNNTIVDQRTNIQEFINVLQAAQEFAMKVENYLGIEFNADRWM